MPSGSPSTSRRRGLEGNLDHVRLALLLKNLISNALRYAGDGKVRRCAAGRQDDAIVSHCRRRRSRLLREDQVANFGEPFYRGDPSRTRSTGGYGLGLYLAKLVAEAHGGSARHRRRPIKTAPETRRDIARDSGARLCWRHGHADWQSRLPYTPAANNDLSKDEAASIDVELDGIVGDARIAVMYASAGTATSSPKTRRAATNASGRLSRSKNSPKSPRTSAWATRSRRRASAQTSASRASRSSRDCRKARCSNFPSGCGADRRGVQPAVQVHERGSRAKLHGHERDVSVTAFSKAGNAEAAASSVSSKRPAGSISAGDQVTVTVYETPSAGWLRD